MTWLLVSARPDDEMMIPVPAASPPVTALTRFTTDGLTFAAIDCTSMLACWPLLELPFETLPVLGSYCGICCWVGKLLDRAGRVAAVVGADRVAEHRGEREEARDRERAERATTGFAFVAHDRPRRDPGGRGRRHRNGRGARRGDRRRRGRAAAGGGGGGQSRRRARWAGTSAGTEARPPDEAEARPAAAARPREAGKAACRRGSTSCVLQRDGRAGGEPVVMTVPNRS